MKETSRYLLQSFRYALILLLIFWIVQIINYLSGYSLYSFGILPRARAGLPGIITAPFIHGSFQHLIANSFPFLILSTLLFFFYRKKALTIFILIWLTAGIITWIIGRSSWHIGASIIIYALASFLLFGGIFSRKISLILVSLFVALAYYGLVWGLFPTGGQVSWEGHLAGAISGFIWAYYYRKSLQLSSE